MCLIFLQSKVLFGKIHKIKEDKSMKRKLAVSAISLFCVLSSAMSFPTFASNKKEMHYLVEKKELKSICKDIGNKYVKDELSNGTKFAQDQIFIKDVIFAECMNSTLIFKDFFSKNKRHVIYKPVEVSSVCIDISRNAKSVFSEIDEKERETKKDSTCCLFCFKSYCFLWLMSARAAIRMFSRISNGFCAIFCFALTKSRLILFSRVAAKARSALFSVSIISCLKSKR